MLELSWKSLQRFARMIPIEEHDILSFTDITNKFTDVRTGVHRSDNQSDPIILVLVFHLVDNGKDLGLRGEDIFAIRTDPVTSSPSINSKGLETSVGMQNPVISTGPADPVLELNAEAVVARTLFDRHFCIIDELLSDETIRSAEHIIVIDPLTEIPSESFGPAPEAGSCKTSPSDVPEQHANLKIVDFTLSVNEHSNLPPESWLRSMYIMVNG